MDGLPSDAIPAQQPRDWNKRHKRMAARLADVIGVHYVDFGSLRAGAPENGPATSSLIAR